MRIFIQPLETRDNVQTALVLVTGLGQAGQSVFLAPEHLIDSYKLPIRGIGLQNVAMINRAERRKDRLMVCK